MKEQWWSLFVWIVDVVLQMSEYCIVLTEMKVVIVSDSPSFRRDVVNEVFLKYSKESRSSLSHVEIRNSHQIFVMIAHNIIICHLKNKAGVRCAKKIPVPWFMFWNISWILVNVWLHNVSFENKWITSV